MKQLTEKTSALPNGRMNSKALAGLGFSLLLSYGLSAQIGCASMPNNNPLAIKGTSNTTGGLNSMAAMTTGTGQNNTAFGVKALNANSSSHNNSAFGLSAAVLTTGGDNAAFGCAALSSNTSG